MSLPVEINPYEKQIYDLQQLIEISKALSSSLDHEYLIQAILEMCLAQVQTMQSALFLVPDMDADFLSLVDTYMGFELDREPLEYRIPVDSMLMNFFEMGLKKENKNQMDNLSLTIAEYEAKVLDQESALMKKFFPKKGEAEPVTLKQLEERFSKDNTFQTLRSLGAELIVALMGKGKVTGLLVLGKKAVGGEYPESECKFLINLASLAGIAVDNARLYERATTDRMTGLKNNAYFQDRLKEEREKALKNNTALSMMFTDVDKFKNFNDTYGHQAGDAVLKGVAAVLLQATRKGHFAARYGGEEFCIVMPGVDEKKALEIAEHTRKSVEDMCVQHEQLNLKVTMSVGVSLFNKESDKTNEHLIERADKALYACKEGGRNQVRSYTDDMG